jgi:hypothetical protein
MVNRYSRFFCLDVSNEGYNPFYKEPISKVNTSNPTISTSTANATSNRNEFTSEHRNALITVSICKNENVKYKSN